MAFVEVIVSSKPSSASLSLDPSPFVNLVTVIPVPDDNDAVSFFVGLQVDLVEQPNAILEKMKNGTYVINYQQMNIPPYIPGYGIATDPVDEYFRELPSSAAATPLVQPEIMRMITCPMNNEQQVQQEWNRLLLDQSRDFVHVLSLKGFFLYCSRACASLLEYDSEELVGHALSSICHPSDIVPLMRDIKDAAVGDSDKMVSLLYRVRRKYSGYMWIECQGKLHVDVSKGRKCLILSGRERPVYRLSVKELSHANALFARSIGQRHPSDPLTTEFWSKMSLNGLFLRVTSSVVDVLGHKCQTLEGSSLFRFAGDAYIPDISRVLGLVTVGKIVNLSHTMRNHRGMYVKMLSTFYPGDVAFGVGMATFALVQTRLASPADGKLVNGVYPVVDPSRSDDDNLFAELETVRSTSWQYELHQLEQANAKLRAQIEALEPGSDKKKKKAAALVDDDPSKICAHCHRTDSPEWRRGPGGPKELCNACGLKYAKTLSSSGKNKQKGSDEDDESSVSPAP
ncbi:hypothetical protein BX666DRAFT_2031764 [Dichotomocladium elegans]|nr:hypothetical protein BX666DRAFT_2031764 [Dichotomocladium elegans]